MKLEATNPLALLFNLASNVSVPRPANKDLLDWPVLDKAKDPRSKSFEEVAKEVDDLRFGEHLPPEWTFRSRAGMVVWTLKSISQRYKKIPNDDNCPDNAAICYVAEYFWELLFQRFFAWAVWERAKNVQGINRQDFIYRNSFASPRAVLALPLFVELLRDMKAVIGQGNFGYRPSTTQQWVYPHLKNYLLAFYYPWVPDKPGPSSERITCPPEQFALERAIKRSKSVCIELWTILSGAPSLRLDDSSKDYKVMSLSEVKKELFKDSNEFVGSFVKTAVCDEKIGLQWIWKEYIQEEKLDINQLKHIEVEAIRQCVNDKISGLLNEDSNYSLEPIKSFLEEGVCAKMVMTGCANALDYRLKSAYNMLATTDPLIKVLTLLNDVCKNIKTNEANPVSEFLKWRFLEERLRIVVDSLFMNRRTDDHTVGRKYFVSHFEEFGVQAVEIPEIQLNLEMPDMRKNIWTGELHSEGEVTQCREWLSDAKTSYETPVVETPYETPVVETPYETPVVETPYEKPAKFWFSGKYPRHALFETYIKDIDVSKNDKIELSQNREHFILATLLAYLIPPPEETGDDKAYISKFNRFDGYDLENHNSITELLNQLEQLAVNDKSHKPFEKLRSLKEDRVTGHYWERITKYLGKILRCNSAQQENINDINASHVIDEIENTTLSELSIKLLNLSEDEINKLLPEKTHSDKKTRRFFSLRTWFSVNKNIFRAMRIFGNGHNLITTRLLNIERPIGNETHIFWQAQDYADFIGTFVVWDKEEDCEPITEMTSFAGATQTRRKRDKREAKPMTDAWRQEKHKKQESWISELYFQQMLIRHLGTDLVRHLRTREREKALEVARNEAIKAGFAAIMSRNMSHNVGSHVSPRATVEAIEGRLEELDKDLNAENKLQIIRYLKSRLDEYIQKKSDFLSEIITEPLSTTKPARFYCDVIVPFITNSLLTDNLAANESIRFKELCENHLKIKFFRKTDSGLKELKLKYNGTYIYPDKFPYHVHQKVDSKLGLLNKPQIENGDYDVLVELPGPLGEFAFYSFLENVIRNTAKHNKDKLRDNNLEINILIEKKDEDNDFYYVKIYDNVSEPDKKVTREKDKEITLLDQLKKYVKSPIIDEITGELKREAWGIAELKICTKLMAGSTNFANWEDEESLKINEYEHEEKKYLAYEFKLMKSKLLCAVIPTGNYSDKEKELKENGILAVRSIEELIPKIEDAKSKATHRFFYLRYDDIENSPNKNNYENLVRHMHKLPFRLIISSSGETQDLPENLREIIERGSAVHTNENIDVINWNRSEIESMLWETWLTRWLPDEEKGEVVVYLEQKSKESPTKEWLANAHKFNKQSEKIKVHVRCDDSNEASSHADVKRVFFDRHSQGIRETDKADFLNKDTYILLDKNNSDFIKIFSPIFPNQSITKNSSEEQWTLPYELMEAGLLKILIIDERITEKSLAKPGTSADPCTVAELLVGTDAPPLMWHLAKGAQIYIATHLKINNNESQPLHEVSYYNLLQNSDENPVPYLEVNISMKENYRFKYKWARDSEWKYSLENKLILHDKTFEKDENGNYKSLYENLDVDMLIIHQGILDDINRKHGLPVKEFLSMVKRNIPFVVVDSGRGIPPTLKNVTVKFIPYSVLQDTVGGIRTAKLSLTQTVMSLSRRIKGEER